MFFVKNTKTLINQHCLMILSLRKKHNSRSQPCQQILLFSESSSVNHNYDLYFYLSVSYFRDEIPFFYYRISKRGGCKNIL